MRANRAKVKLCGQLKILMDHSSPLTGNFSLRTACCCRMGCAETTCSYFFAGYICLLHFVCQVCDCGYQFSQIPRKQYLKSVLNKFGWIFFLNWSIYFLPLGQSFFLSKHRINRLFNLGLETGFHLNTFQMRIVCANTVKTANLNPV